MVVVIDAALLQKRKERERSCTFRSQKIFRHSHGTDSDLCVFSAQLPYSCVLSWQALWSGQKGEGAC